jgi:hypothetical protein
VQSQPNISTAAKQIAAVLLVGMLLDIAYYVSHDAGLLWPRYLRETVLLATILGFATLTFRAPANSWRQLFAQCGAIIASAAIAGLLAGFLLTGYVLLINPDYPEQMGLWLSLDSPKDSAGMEIAAAFAYAPFLVVITELAGYSILGTLAAVLGFVVGIFRKTTA